MAVTSVVSPLDIGLPQQQDLDALVALEQQCFDSDRLSRRQFKHWLKAPGGVFLVVREKGLVVAYGLVIMRKGTRLARLYSLAVSPLMRGRGVARELLLALEQATVAQGKLFMRLEVAADNSGAIHLYQQLGYRTFGTYSKYYDNGSDALRMQKPIRQVLSARRLGAYPWYPQSTEFTCGPAALMMAMKRLRSAEPLNLARELWIWRQATTIYMTSGHGGCHPLGLGLAATELGFQAQVYINQHEPLFLDGVRSEHKKDILRAVHEQFVTDAGKQDIQVLWQDPSVERLQAALAEGAAVLCLISTYRMDGRKVPHWVTVTHIDEDCLYLHDPYPDDEHPHPMDCQHIPVAREDFSFMAAYGKNKLRTAVVVYPATKD
ncbi:GNAT family N-acetyltransferase/peptidase C39 family protein [Aestuariibacter halophilus]|uniref:GNAT family N-acetyltransferase/peptidase C39 family protein n=1 Tax=Fluctibacter halophilus TaxID=226011 RepID=A0ABS8G9F0_9ALTE|nr:GNAT family N-acetyltransferase/peptidase C39 family protein [Aestuariibacter halophilus]MCC2616440.1 GNAT family N-acetyltransferase/peptidase C39 family protein [Aestuariibacter halophilus]